MVGAHTAMAVAGRRAVAEVAFDDHGLLAVLGIVLQDVVQLLQPEMGHRRMM